MSRSCPLQSMLPAPAGATVTQVGKRDQCQVEHQQSAFHASRASVTEARHDTVEQRETPCGLHIMSLCHAAGQLIYENMKAAFPGACCASQVCATESALTLLLAAAITIARAGGNPDPGPSPSGSSAAAEGTADLTRMRRVPGRPPRVDRVLAGATDAVERRAMASCAGFISESPVQLLPTALPCVTLDRSGSDCAAGEASECLRVLAVLSPLLSPAGSHPASALLGCVLAATGSRAHPLSPAALSVRRCAVLGPWPISSVAAQTFAGLLAVLAAAGGRYSRSSGGAPLAGERGEPTPSPLPQLGLGACASQAATHGLTRPRCGGRGSCPSVVGRPAVPKASASGL